VPTYLYSCDCGHTLESVRPIAERDILPTCMDCAKPMQRVIGAPLFKFAGRVTPGGGPDRFTADMLGIPLKELPDGLKS
jgi:putative FmdB family regulatory protein